MNTAHFHQHFERSIPRIQCFASELTKDFDTARFLYLETAHQAMKQKVYLKPDTFDDWLINTMTKTYQMITPKKR